MLLNNDKKGMAAIIIKKIKGDKMPSSESSNSEKEYESEDSNEFDCCASEVMDALKSGDIKQFGSALKDFISMAMSEED